MKEHEALSNLTHIETGIKNMLENMTSRRTYWKSNCSWESYTAIDVEEWRSDIAHWV